MTTTPPLLPLLKLLLVLVRIMMSLMLNRTPMWTMRLTGGSPGAGTPRRVPRRGLRSRTQTLMLILPPLTLMLILLLLPPPRRCGGRPSRSP